MLALFVVSLSVFLVSTQCRNVSIEAKIDLEQVINTVDERYLSLALEAGIFWKHWGTFNVRSPRLHTLVSALSPAYLRVGGSSANFLYFNKTGKHRSSKDWKIGSKDIKSYFAPPRRSNGDFEGDVFLSHKNYSNFTMTGHDFDALNKFVDRVNFRLMFDINQFNRKDGKWDPDNAREILEYSITRNYTHNMDLQLGNEPCAYNHAFNRNITAHQSGEDMLVLESMVNGDYKKYFSNSILVGPDITRPKKKSLEYMREYLGVVKSTINAVTWHHYYVNGRTASVSDFLSPVVLDSLRPMLDAVVSTVKNSTSDDISDPGLPMWMGETSSAWGGGAPGLSDRFVAGFMWLDKLGMAAQHQQKLVVRQSLYEGHYAILDEGLNPMPDYWLSVLFKRLVGRKVFRTETPSSSIRIYAHCTNTAASRSGSFPVGSVTVYGLNLKEDDAIINLPQELQNENKTKFILSAAGRSSMRSKYVKLNGHKLKMLNDYLLPKMAGKRMAESEPLVIPARSMAYFVIDASVATCSKD